MIDDPINPDDPATPDTNANDNGVSQDQAEDAVSNAPEGAPDRAAPALDAAALFIENAELKDRLLRTIAEMENLRRRTEREKRDAGKYAINNFAQDLLSIGDNLARAMQSIADADGGQTQDMVKSLVDGIEMTEREMLNVFDRHGIAKLDPIGGKFDPNLHQAIFEVDKPELPTGTVTDVMQAGYTLNERILRPAMVGVSKGGSKAPPRAPEGDPATPTDTSSDTQGTSAQQDPANLGKTIDKSA